jgi:hypothetical protein
MNKRIEKIYSDNQKYLNSIFGLTITSAEQEQYFFEGKLDNESLGTLKLSFSDGKELTFNCDGDAESLNISPGSFTDKGNLETDFTDNRFKWLVKDYLSKQDLIKLGKIIDCKIELLSNDFGTIQSGCKLLFENLNFLYIWTIESDKIFYGLNQIPPYHNNTNLKIKHIAC